MTSAEDLGSIKLQMILLQPSLYEIELNLVIVWFFKQSLFERGLFYQVIMKSREMSKIDK